LTAQSRNSSSQLHIQSKLWIDRSEAIDSILSKFQSYESNHNLDSSGNQYLLDLDNPTTQYMVVTLSSLKGILKRYEEQRYSSRNFYQQLTSERHLHFIDGYQILAILRAAYSKISL
jgi:hypothetical protein